MTLVTMRNAMIGDADVLELWDRDPDVGYSGGEDDFYDWHKELQRTVPWREILIAEVDGRPIGVVVLIDAANEENHYWGNVEESGAWALDIWIGEARDRSRGYGRQMIETAIGRCFGLHSAPVVLIDPLASNTRAISFYERCGFSVVGARRFGSDDCLVMSIRPE